MKLKRFESNGMKGVCEEANGLAFVLKAYRQLALAHMAGQLAQPAGHRQARMMGVAGEHLHNFVTRTRTTRPCAD